MVRHGDMRCCTVVLLLLLLIACAPWEQWNNPTSPSIIMKPISKAPSSSILAFDIGTRRTGVAIAPAGTRMAVARNTICHTSPGQLTRRIVALLQEYSVHRIILGLPLLPSGEEGSQVSLVRAIGSELAKKGVKVSYIDERYTTVRKSQYDGNAAAACDILSLYIDRERNLT